MADDVKFERRTLYTGLMGEYFPSRTFVMPKITVALPEPEGVVFKPGEGFREYPEWVGRNYNVILFGGLDKPISARFRFDNDEEGETFYYKLLPSNLVQEGGKAVTMQDDLKSWLENRIFITPELMKNNGSEEQEVDALLSNRPYKFGEVACAGASIVSEVSFFGGKEPRNASILFSRLLRSEEMPAEEVARRMKR